MNHKYDFDVLVIDQDPVAMWQPFVPLSLV